MSTNQNPTVKDFLTAQTDEAEVRAFFARKLAENSDLPNLRLSFGSGYYKNFVADMNDGAGEYRNYFGDSVDEAIRDVRAQIKSPEEQAAQKRAAAAKLLAEADALSPVNPMDRADVLEREEAT